MNVSDTFRTIFPLVTWIIDFCIVKKAIAKCILLFTVKNVYFEGEVIVTPLARTRDPLVGGIGLYVPARLPI
jgi:hypothetical protein